MKWCGGIVETYIKLRTIYSVDEMGEDTRMFVTNLLSHDAMGFREYFDELFSVSSVAASIYKFLILFEIDCNCLRTNVLGIVCIIIIRARPINIMRNLVHKRR